MVRTSAIYRVSLVTFAVTTGLALGGGKALACSKPSSNPALPPCCIGMVQQSCNCCPSANSVDLEIVSETFLNASVGSVSLADSLCSCFSQPKDSGSPAPERSSKTNGDERSERLAEPSLLSFCEPRHAGALTRRRTSWLITWASAPLYLCNSRLLI